ncbi:MAG: hypothetical protein NTW87_21265 [Planctomycetota bacterium]|nr:hypothetical protein [Planctomycetota bacterium]
MPPHVRQQAAKAFRLFLADPHHRGLHFKPLQRCPEFWSVRVTLSYRAVCRRDGDTVYWFWIGSHADFDQEFG